MTYDPKTHHRRSIRLRGYDYSQSGAYFVTVCTHKKTHLFGEVVEGAIGLKEVGRVVQSVWEQMPRHYPNCRTDAFVVMPNHIHAIIRITAPIVVAGRGARPDGTESQFDVGAGPRACPDAVGSKRGQPQGVAPTLSLFDLVHRFKSLTTTRYRQGIALYAWPPLPDKLWQRNYYEHIIRNDNELNKIREYIRTNPLRWDTDPENL